MTPDETAEIIKTLERIADVLEYFAENGVSVRNATYISHRGCGVPRTEPIPFITEEY